MRRVPSLSSSLPVLQIILKIIQRLLQLHTLFLKTSFLRGVMVVVDVSFNFLDLSIEDHLGLRPLLFRVLVVHVGDCALLLVVDVVGGDETEWI
jgi:hypothetical protein